MKAESYTYEVIDWNATNNAKKTNKYADNVMKEKTCEAASQFDINKAIQRAFTKAMAMH
jgi:hypothetical protein